MSKSDILRARWTTLAALSIVFGLYLFTSTSWHPLLSITTTVLVASLLTFALEFWLRIFTHQTPPMQSLVEDKNTNEESYSDSKKMLELFRTFMRARSEKEILETALAAGMEILKSPGSSFVPYDEWGQSLPSLIVGKVPESALQSWTQRLSLPETRQTCKNCEALHGDSGCVLLSSAAGKIRNVQCFPMNSSGREVGVINFFFEGKSLPGEIEKSHFRIVLDAAGQALENLHSRDQEIAALHYLQTINSPKSDLSILLTSLLNNIQQALDVDYASLYLPGGIPGQLNPNPQYFSISKGEPSHASSNPDLPFMEGLWKSVLTSGHSLSLENVVLNKQEKWKTLLAVPLTWQDEEPAGVLILGSNTNQSFTQRHLALLETLAGQAALLMQNARLLVRVEYQAVVDERTRLAREIHDGLAQTLAFLKIQAAQMQNFLARGETDKLTSTLQANYRTLSDAYIDARQAIDNLRRAPSTDLRDWISQVASDFEQAGNHDIDISIAEYSGEYPVNIQAQLIRIVQEALSNVRKHANATKVSIIGRRDGDSYLIEIRDNGIGFSPLVGEGSGNSHYGLQGMRERSDNIGAEFQITSQPGKGTCVSLRLPVPVKEDL